MSDSSAEIENIEGLVVVVHSAMGNNILYYFSFKLI